VALFLLEGILAPLALDISTRYNFRHTIVECITTHPDTALTGLLLLAMNPSKTPSCLKLKYENH